MNLRRNTKLALLLSAMTVVLMTGCRAKVDLNDIDPSAEVKLGLALPVATASITTADLIGDDKLLNQIQIGTGTDKMAGENGVDKGVLFFRSVKESEKNYHKIDLKNYFQNTTATFKLKDKVSASVIPAGVQTKVTFPLKLSLTGINDALTEERLDKMTIDAANFISNISLSNLSITKDDIEKVEIVLYGSNRNAGKAASEITQGYFEVEGNSPKTNDYTFEVKGFQKQGFGRDIPIEINNFDIVLMKVYKETFANLHEGNENVVSELGFDFVFTLRPSSNITINDNSAFIYQFKINFLDYSALYGYFKPSNLMRDNDTDTISSQFEEWSKFSSMQLALAKPRIDLAITCAIAAPLTVRVESISVSNKDKSITRQATFNEAGTQHQKFFDFENDVKIHDPFDQTATNYFYLNEETDRGNLDYLFQINPEYLHWDYYLTVRDERTVTQHRLTKNTDIQTETTITIPFQFMEGMSIGYTDTTDIDWAGMSLDSLKANSDYIDSIGTSHVKLRLKVDNTIPLDVRFAFNFLDAKGNTIDLSGLEITTDGKSSGDTLLIKAATEVEAGGNVSSISGKQVATSTSIWMNLSEEEFNKITQATQLVYKATINTSDKSFKENKWVNVRDVSGLDIQLGVAADVDAFLHLDLSKKDNN